MDRLNYFNPYVSKNDYHEDQLTRAYLVLLKHSSHAFFTFIEYVRSMHKPKDTEKPISILDFLESGWVIETQKSNPKIDTNYLLSILITDEHITTQDERIQSSERNARYDGVIVFDKNLTMVIENKPRSGDIWIEQLNPALKNRSGDTIVYEEPVILAWKEILKQLNHLTTVQTISGNEKLMIEDFLSYIDQSFPFLNPYDKFHQCKGNYELLNRRIANLLKSISLDESKVKYHKGWGYYIQTPYDQITKIGLILFQKEGEWWLELSLFFGATQKQAISFYKSEPDISRLNENNGMWKAFPNFHVSFMTSNLVWFQSEDSVHYLQFWRNNINKIEQQKKENVSNYLQWLVKEKVIKITKAEEERLEEKFYKTAMQNLNICPEFGLTYTITSNDAEQDDKNGNLKFDLAEKIREGLNVVGLDGNKILKDTQKK